MADDHQTHVALDLGDLRDIAIWLRDEAQSVSGDRDHLSPKVHFGQHSPCGETQSARRAALSALDEQSRRWEEHREELTSLATALDKALDHYADSEHLGKTEQ